MNEFTDKNEQAFLDACGAIGVKPQMVNTQKERYPVAEFLKNPVSWLWKLKAFITLYTTRREAPGGRTSWP